MQAAEEVKRRTPTKLQQRFSLILQDLKCQLRDIDDSSLSQSATDVSHIRTDSFSKIDVFQQWVIPYPTDEYAEKPQER